MTTKVFPATTEALNDVLAFVEEEITQTDCPLKVVMQIMICVEEMFVNVAHYAYGPDGGDADVTVDTANQTISISIKDSGMAFDPLEKEDPDVTLSAEERDIGGLGIFMVKKTMDEVDYRREDGFNLFTMKKRF